MKLHTGFVAIALFATLHHTTQTAHTSCNHNDTNKTAYHAATDEVADVFGDMLYPIQKLWGKIVNTFSPHHPIMDDIKKTTDYVGDKVPKIAEVIVEKMRKKAHDINDYILQEAEQTMQRISHTTAQVITESSEKALKRTQQTIEESTKRATQSALIDIKKAHQELMNTTEQSMQNILVNAHQELTETGKDIGQAIAHEVDKTVQKNTSFAAKSALITAVGSTGLGLVLLGSHKYMESHDRSNIGFIGSGAVLAAAAYKALDLIAG